MEAEFLEWLRDRLPADSRLPLGITDDAALLRLAPGVDGILTSDLLADGVHFVLREGGAGGAAPAATPRQVGRKALAVNLSDLAAMAARPVAAVVAVLVPRQDGETLARELYEGLLPLAEEFGVAIAGGDTNSWEGPLVVCVTAVGQASRQGPLTRSGARPGDALLVTGSLGGSLSGRHLEFTPRVTEALELSERYDLHAGIDVSDGLALDLWRLCQASGCGAELDLASVPVSSAAQELAGDDLAALAHALGDGEDFELLLALPEGEAQRLLEEQPLGVPLTRIGRFSSEPGLWQLDNDGARQPLEARGYSH